MKAIPFKQLIKMALLTAPLIAIIYCTPVYILDAVPNMSFFVIFPIFTMPVLLAWFLNLLLIFLIDRPWILSYWRTILISALMFTGSGIALLFIHPPVDLSDSSLTVLRIVNILSVNTIIYVLVDLILTKGNKNRIELENANLRIATLEAEFKSLKDQINPHFLFNALSTAKALIKQQPQLAEEYLVKLSEFLRASVNNDQKTISLKDELQLGKDFVALNKIRFGDALKVEYTLPADISGFHVPYFAIVSLLENAIKHNSLTSAAPLKISISMVGEMIEVKNNKNAKFVMEPPSRTGLINLGERYRLICEKQPVINESDIEFSVQIPLLRT